MVSTAAAQAQFSHFSAAPTAAGTGSSAVTPGRNSTDTLGCFFFAAGEGAERASISRIATAMRQVLRTA